jgi:hypothetical protein
VERICGQDVPTKPVAEADPASCTDDDTGATIQSGHVFPLGVTNFHCGFDDPDQVPNAGADTAFTIEVVDTTPPVIPPLSDVTTDQNTDGGAVIEFGADGYPLPDAHDVVAGDIVLTCTSPAVEGTFTIGQNVFFPNGTNEVDCSATDERFNTATASFMVTINSTGGGTNNPPVLTVPADFTVEWTGGASQPVTFVVTANDPEEGPLRPGNPGDDDSFWCMPASGDNFAYGQTEVDCIAKDAQGNAVLSSFNITIADTTAPTLHLPAPISKNATSASGVVVTYAASASDPVEGAVPISCSPASGTVFSIGAHTVNCSATDVHGNTTTGSFAVTVIYVTPPVLHLPANITQTASAANGNIVTYTATATDGIDGTDPVHCTPASGSRFLGTTTVSCSATNSVGLTATGSFTVTVTFDFCGFDLPALNPPLLWPIATPVRFRLCGASAGITTLSAQLYYAKYMSNGTLGTEHPATAPLLSVYTANNFRYVTLLGILFTGYDYTWDTTPRSRGQYRLRADLGDGASHTLNVSLQ